MLIYKILTAPQWAELQNQGETDGALIDVTDGFIHFSTATQAAETAAKHFAGQDDLYLLAMDADRFGDVLKWETSRGGDLFPHLYARLKLKDVVWSERLVLVDGSHQFPPGMT